MSIIGNLPVAMDLGVKIDLMMRDAKLDKADANNVDATTIAENLTEALLHSVNKQGR